VLASTIFDSHATECFSAYALTNAGIEMLLEKA
jgi:hypothetical protein